MKKKQILIVEDEIIIATEVEYKLKSFGYDTLGIANTEAMISEVISSQIPDLILMDINLNLDIDGIEIAQKIRNHHNIPIVFMTSYSDENTLQRAKDANPYGYILKPYEDRSLKVTLEMAFGKHDMEMKVVETEKRFERLYQNMPIGLYKTSIDGKFIIGNEVTATMLGYSSFDDLLELDVNEMFHNQSIDRDFFISEIRDSDKAEVLEFKWVRPDKTIIYLQENAKAIRDKDGNILYFEGIIQDVTQKKIAEHKITKLNQMYTSFQVDPTRNIQIIVDNAHEILDASYSLYTKLVGRNEDNMMIYAGANLPDGISHNFKGSGHICYDETIKGKNKIIAIPKVKETAYYTSDSFVQEFNIKAYLGHPIVVNENCIGALCVFYDEERDISSTDKQIISTLSKSLALEEARLHTLELLAESESKYKIMIDNVHDHIFQVNTDLELISYNQKFKEILGGGFVPKKICSKSSNENFLTSYCQAIKSVFETGKAVMIEAAHDNSGKIFFETIFTPLFDEDSNVNGVIGLGRDISGQKVMENVVAESEKRFRSIFENISTLAVHGCNENHKITYWNKACEKFYGFSAAEVMGDSIFDVLKNITLSGDNKSGELFIVRKDGSKIKVSRSNVKIFNFYGNPEYYSLDMDLTDITQTKDALEMSEKNFENLTSISPMGIVLMDQNGMVEYVNRKMMDICEVERDELLGDQHLEFVHPDDIAEVKQYWNEAIATESNVELEFRFRTGSSKVVWVLAVIKPYHDSTDKLKGYIGVFADITARKSTENDLNTHQEHVKLINKILRHDLTNNLTVINSALRIYSRSHEEKMLIEAKLTIKKGFELIDRMRELELYISTHNNLSLYNVMSVLRTVSQNYPNIEINLVGKGQVMADEAIFPIFDNIISNSIKHGNTSKIDIVVSDRNGFTTIKICDFGKGINKNIRDKIFDERFTHGKSGGSGLGLYIVKMNVDRYEGQVSVEDNIPSGVCITIKLRSV